MRTFLTALLILIAILMATPSASHACGHDGLYIGAGYSQSLMFSADKRRAFGFTNDRVLFGPGFGGHVVVGYDFCGSRWGLQVPFEFTTMRLNRSERVMFMSGAIEPVLHIASWENGMDFHLIGGVGPSYLNEGTIRDLTSSVGINFGMGPGLSWFLSRQNDFSVAASLDVPFRVIYFFGNRLSNNGTLVFNVPLRLSFTFGF
ncbi:MAG: hypothetical protein HY540_02410 [Deltaproteobacteria bacterium]|nr:hypothetical protein [Deltaproteobacteria bacterium]